MPDTILSRPAITDAPSPPPTEPSLAGRRLLMALLCLGSMAGLGWAMSEMLSARGWSASAALFMAMFMISLPWTLLGFWNSVVGFVILRLVSDPVAFTNPAIGRTPPDSPIVTRTALCLAIRHEDVAGVFERLAQMIDGVRATGWGDGFDVHILSDSSRPEIAEEEALAFARLAARHGDPSWLHYRRRSANTGFKAGNLREFALRAGNAYDHMITLDADSLMSPAAMLRLVRAMQANPRLGILQTLVVGRPSDSAFTRVFQFGMRQSMRTQTVGTAWWQGSSGPYWGHNAILRMAPFVRHCDLPDLPGRPPLGGPILSHDQVEAALMRAHGWEVRVIADEYESWEENPPSLPDFIKRDLRWCQGNLQYVKLLGRPVWRPMGRFQLINAIMMYMGAPFGMLMLAAGLAMSFAPGSGQVPVRLGFILYFGMMLIGFAPRFLGAADILLMGQARRYGGIIRLAAGAVIDALFSIWLAPIMMVAQAIFVAGLLFGRRVLWDAQIRRGHAVPLRAALRGLWPQMLFGALFGLGVWLRAPGALPWAMPTILPALLAAPFASVTASGWLGRAMTRARLCAIPDEFTDG